MRLVRKKWNLYFNESTANVAMDVNLSEKNEPENMFHISERLVTEILMSRYWCTVDLQTFALLSTKKCLLNASLFLCVLPCLLIDNGWMSSHPCCQQEANAVSQGLGGTAIWPSGGTGLSPVTSGPQHSQREPSRGELLYAWFRVQSWLEDFCHLCKLVTELHHKSQMWNNTPLLLIWLSIDGCSMNVYGRSDQCTQGV